MTHELRRTKTQTRCGSSPTWSFAFETLSCTHNKEGGGNSEERERISKKELETGRESVQKRESARDGMREREKEHERKKKEGREGGREGI